MNCFCLRETADAAAYGRACAAQIAGRKGTRVEEGVFTDRAGVLDHLGSWLVDELANEATAATCPARYLGLIGDGRPEIASERVRPRPAKFWFPVSSDFHHFLQLIYLLPPVSIYKVPGTSHIVQPCRGSMWLAQTIRRATGTRHVAADAIRIGQAGRVRPRENGGHSSHIRFHPARTRAIHRHGRTRAASSIYAVGGGAYRTTQAEAQQGSKLPRSLTTTS